MQKHPGVAVINTKLLKQTQMMAIPMKTNIIILFLIISGLSASVAQNTEARPYYSANTAYLIDRHTWETGLGQVFRYGLTPKLELNTYAFKFPVSPNAGIKIDLGQKGLFRLASEHAFNYPSPLLNTISREGIGGVISPEFEFPFILTITNNLLATVPLSETHLLTLKAGWIFALRGSQPDYRSSIDLPVFYPRMAHYYKGSSIRFSAGLKGKITGRLWYDEGLQFFCITRSSHNFFVENTGSVAWAAGHRFSFRLGYNVSYGRYPFGNHWQLWPTFDLVFGSKRSSGTAVTD